jgi:hypothetical protein
MQFFDIFTNKKEKSVSTITIDSEFKLPIDYLDANVVHTLSPIVASDLELDSCVYEIALKPQNEYAKDMIKRVKTKYTSHTGFLENTQDVVSNVVSEYVRPRMACPEKIAEIWKDVYEVEGFHDRYSFIDIPQFKYINHVSGFMGFWTIVNLMSPLLSLFLPLIFMVAPFVLLKIQGVPIGFSSYLGVLKNIAKSHFIGKTLNAIGGGDFSINNVLYLIFTLALYGLQMYQNVKACIRFYKNISVVNERLITIKEFADYSVASYDGFLAKFQGTLEHYTAFCDDVRSHRDLMVTLRTDLDTIKPFEFSIGKCFEVGNLLKCYYGLFDIEDHRRAVAYAVGFDSYLNLVSGLNVGLNAGYLGRGTFVKEDTDKETTSSDKETTSSDKETTSSNGTSSKKTQFVDQVYPSHAELDEKVANTMDLSANIIITGPNASGKTTQLKTTAINIILTQQFGVGFYTSCELVPYTHIHSYLNIPDTSGRDSLFQAEARRCKEILDVVATSDTDSTRHFCVFDELFSGTNAEEATSASFGFLKYLQAFANVDFILTTHFVKLCQKVEKAGALRIANYMMDAELCDKEIVFTYDMIPGISKIKAAKLILIQMGFPDEIISGMA